MELRNATKTEHFWLCFMLFMIAGCVSFGEKIPKVDIERELAWSSEFKSCVGIDGGVKLISKNPLISSLVMDWISSRKEGFRAEVSDPIGQLVLGLKMNKGEFELEGPMAAKAKGLSVTKKGVFSFDGNDIPIRWYEIACFLKGAFPKSWLFHGTSIGYRTKEKVLIAEWSDFRTIEVSKQGTLQCADIRWSIFLGFFEESVKYCYDKKSKVGTLSYEKDKLAWEPYDE